MWLIIANKDATKVFFQRNTFLHILQFQKNTLSLQSNFFCNGKYIQDILSTFAPNIKELSEILEVSRKSLLTYLIYLEKAQLIGLLQQDVSGLKTFTKPEKIYLDNSNLAYALETEKPDLGNIRETFFFNQLNIVSKVISGGKPDFKIDNKYTIEVGGKNKGHEQIMGIENAHLALDNLEYGFMNKIPLWLFGMLY